MIPFGLTTDQFATRSRGLLEKHSPALITELREVFAVPIGEAVTSASVVIFLDDPGVGGPSIGLYFDGRNKKVDSSDPTIFPGRVLMIAEYLRELPTFDPSYFSDDEFGALDIQTNVTKQWFAEWWWKAGGWDYPLPVDVSVHDGYGDGESIQLSPGT